MDHISRFRSKADLDLIVQSVRFVLDAPQCSHPSTLSSCRRGLRHCAVRTLQSVDPVKQRLKRPGRGESDLWGPNWLHSAPRAVLRTRCSMGPPGPSRFFRLGSPRIFFGLLLPLSGTLGSGGGGFKDSSPSTYVLRYRVI